LGNPYAAGNKAFGFCDRCSFRYPLHELKDEFVDLEKTGLLVCDDCWDDDHPQNQLGRYPVEDPQALRNPRPDSGLSDSRSGYRTDSEQYVESFNFSNAKSNTITNSEGDEVLNINGMVFHNSYASAFEPFTTAKMTLNQLSNTVNLVGENLTGYDPNQFSLTYDSVYGGSDVTRVIDSSKYKTVEVRMRKVSSGTVEMDPWNSPFSWRFLWRTSSTAFGSGGEYFTPDPEFDSPLGKLGDGWFTMSIDLSKNANWTANGTDITAWRFWMGIYSSTSSGDKTETFELDYVNFYAY
jgi:hypothetical protein